MYLTDLTEEERALHLEESSRILYHAIRAPGQDISAYLADFDYIIQIFGEELGVENITYTREALANFFHVNDTIFSFIMSYFLAEQIMILPQNPDIVLQLDEQSIEYIMLPDTGLIAIHS